MSCNAGTMTKAKGKEDKCTLPALTNKNHEYNIVGIRSSIYLTSCSLGQTGWEQSCQDDQSTVACGTSQLLPSVHHCTVICSLSGKHNENVKWEESTCRSTECPRTTHAGYVTKNSSSTVACSIGHSAQVATYSAVQLIIVIQPAWVIKSVSTER